MTDLIKRLRKAAMEGTDPSPFDTICHEAADEIERLLALLEEVAACFTRDDDLPDNLLPRIDAAMQHKEQSNG